MKVLVACEFSGRVRDAFLAKGADAISCDFLPTESEGPHYQGDVRDLLDQGFDLMIAHPPCQYLAKSGVRWLHTQEGRWEHMRKGGEFFKELLEAPIAKKCIENPVIHRYAVEVIGRKQDQVVYPWMFGHPERKATCLWLENLPLLSETHNVQEEMLGLPINLQHKTWLAPDSKGRALNRSRTLEGLALAMADQWCV